MGKIMCCKLRRVCAFLFLIFGIINGESLPLIFLDPGKTLGSKDLLSSAIMRMWKSSLEKELGVGSVVISKKSHELLDQLQIAAYANKLQSDLFIHLSVIVDPSVRCSLNLYSFAFNPITDLWHSGRQEAFVPLSQVHYPYAKRSDLLCKKYAQLVKATGFLSVGHQVVGPFKPLRGVDCPAFALECIVTSVEEWEGIAQLLCRELITLIRIEFLDEA